MARKTKRIYSVGQAVRPGPSELDGEGPTEPPTTAAGADARPEIHKVIDVGDPPSDPSPADAPSPQSSRPGDEGAPRCVELPRQEKPLLLTRGRTPASSADHGPQGTVRLSPDEIQMATRDADESFPLERTARPAEEARRCPQCGTQFSSVGVRFCPFDGNSLVSISDWDPSGDPLVGCTVAERYQIQRVIAEGSMGTVYEVTHQRLGARFAMKVLRRDLAREPEVAVRIIEEAKTTAAIGHPNIVAVTDFGEIDADVLPELGSLRLPYYVMELLGGSSLADEIRTEGPLPAQRIARLAAQCASALAAAHARKVVHRDLKPANIRLVRSELDEEMVKVLDFGVAKVLTLSRKTQPGVVFGTPHYMSPEQAKGLAIDERTDVYALGVIMYECITGSVPFEADTYMGVVTHHLFTRPEPIAVAPDDSLGAALETIILRCLAKDPADRYATMTDLARDLERVATGRDAAAAPTRRPLRLREPQSMPGAPPASRITPAGMPATVPVRYLLIGAALVVLAAVIFWYLRPDALGTEPAAAGSAAAPTSAPAGASPTAAAHEAATGAASEAEADAAGSAAGTASPLAVTSTGSAETATSQPKAPPPDPGAPTEAAHPTARVTAPPPRRPPRPSGEVIDPWAR